MGTLRQSQTKKAKSTVEQQTASSNNRDIHPAEELQEMFGNRALGRLIESQSLPAIQRRPLFRGLSHELTGNAQGNLVQAKLTVNQSGDKYEQEADRVAAQVVNQIHHPISQASANPETIQTKELQRKSEPNAQEKIDQPDIEASIQTARGKGQALPENLQQPLEQAFNADFSQVRIHTDSQASQLNQSLEAKALTTGKDIFFRQGEFNPGNRGGQELIAHELTHVVQQNGGAMPQVVQRKNTLKTSDAQTTAGKDHKVKEEDKVKVKQEDIKVATQHPMYVTFQARINQVFSQFPPPDNYDIKLLTRNIWTQVCGAVDTSSSYMERKNGNTTYSNIAKGYVDMESPGYKQALSEFDQVMDTLKKAASSQFLTAKTFGFWSKPEGRALAEKMCDITLETSGIGAIFDGIPSLNAHQNGWDAQLWGALSRAFGEAAAKEMTKKDKSVHVCAGGGTDKTNVFGAVESKALEKGASTLGKTLEEAVTFHSVAAKSKTQREPDLNTQEGELPGTWYSGHSWDESLKIGKQKFDLLPDKV